MFEWELERPLAVFDIESTGVNKKLDRIIDITFVVIQPDGEKVTHNFRVNPEMPIPSGASAVHGIYDDDVKGAPNWKQEAPKVVKLIEGMDLGGFNIINFDIPMMQAEFERVGVPFSMEGRRIFDAIKIYHRKEPRTLTAALKHYCDGHHAGAHNAEDDVLATIRVMEGQLKMYDDVPRDMKGIDAFCCPTDPSWLDKTGKIKWQDGIAVMNFGKNSGVSLGELAKNEVGFLRWMLKNDFADDTKTIVKNAIQGKLPTPPAKEANA